MYTYVYAYVCIYICIHMHIYKYHIYTYIWFICIYCCRCFGTVPKDVQQYFIIFYNVYICLYICRIIHMHTYAYILFIYVCIGVYRCEDDISADLFTKLNDGKLQPWCSFSRAPAYYGIVRKGGFAVYGFTQTIFAVIFFV